jgi:phage FluMu protein Com
MIPVYKCKKCRWIGKDTIFVDGDTECCPRCHDVNFMELVSLEKKSTFRAGRFDTGRKHWID